MTEKHFCTCDKCGHTHRIDPRVIALYRGLVQALYRVYLYVKLKNRGYLFTRKEIKHLLRNENDTARFGDLVLFGGLVFKKSKAHYGLNMERCEAFFRGDYKIPTRILKNPTTGENELVDYKTIREIPSIKALLDKDGYYVPEYRGAT